MNSYPDNSSSPEPRSPTLVDSVAARRLKAQRNRVEEDFATLWKQLELPGNTFRPKKDRLALLIRRIDEVLGELDDARQENRDLRSRIRELVRVRRTIPESLEADPGTPEMDSGESDESQMDVSDSESEFWRDQVSAVPCGGDYARISSSTR
ncbi:hypothetical protein BC834DRAFT_877684 [Gloeopeniophorella convolvens]|nr:hypothetical protein BC834DRAFT_877684 [Gloeopeniophorella convolvens]